MPITFTQVGTDIPSTSTATTGTLYSQAQTGLSAGVIYYYRIASVVTIESGYLLGNQATLPPIPKCGNKTVGPTGDYTSLTAAFTDLFTNGVSCAVNLILQSTYLSTVETFPVAVNAIAGTSATNKVTVYPSATGLSITSNNTTGTINLNGANYVYFDGRVNATGSTKDLVIENLSTTGYTCQFVNVASNNAFQYCIMKGASSSGANGTITFAGTTGLTGNSNNLINYCEVAASASGSPLYAIYSSGSTNPLAYNSNNTISNCLIHDFYAPAGGNPIGVGMFAGSTAWTISGNSFYMVNTLSPTVAVGYNVIFIAAGDGYNILNNYIGGSAPLCGGTPWTLNGNGTPPTIANFIYVIRFAGGLTINPSTVQGNTISNILLYTNPTAASIFFTGLLSVVGIQNISNNVIGSGTGTGSITISVGNGAFASTYEGFDFRGMYGNVMNNTVGSITISGATGSTSTYALTLRPISVTPSVQNGTDIVSGNLVGSLTTANSIQTPAMNFPPLQIQAFFISSVGSGTMSVANNTVANISNLSANTSSHTVGIYSAGTGLPNVLNGNTVRDLTTTSTNTTTSLATLVGIYSLNSVPGSIIRSNNIFNLTNTTGTAVVAAHGIYLGHSAGNILVEKNFIHNIGLTTTSATAQVNGLYLNCSGAYGTVKNNMFQLGINPDGTANTSNCIINGIYESSATVDSVLNNSIYIGGAPAGVTGSTYAFNSVMTPSLSTPRVCMDNIFFNARSGGSTGKHYGIKIAGTTIFPLGVTSNYNLIIANGATGGTFGSFNSVDQATFAAYKAATNTEMASGSSDPNFVAPTGNSATANLHVASPTPIEAAGKALSSVLDDFDGAARSGLTPPDVGADAGNFTLSADAFGPSITYVPIGNGTTANRLLTNWATITDNVGVSGGASLPRVYYKKSTDADAFVGNTSANNGWKYVVASNSSSPFSFTIDYSIINGGSVAAANIIQYFVVAQDAANNLSSNYLMAGASANPPVQNINAAPAVATVQSYTIVSNTIPTTITVPGTYANLTGTGGAFDMINQGVLSGNTTINIAADLVEPGTVPLNAWAEDVPGANYTLTIKPDASILRTISGTAVATGVAMIRTNGASRVTIDGQVGKLLTIRNTNATAGSTGPTIQFNGGSQSCYLKNSTIENNGTTTTYGTVNIGATGVNIVEISGNDIRDAAAGTTGVQTTGIYNASFLNSVKVLNNNIYNFKNYGLYFTTVADGAVITGNSFYYNSATASTVAQYCIYLVGSTNNHTISGNYFGGSAPLCAGTAWTNSTTFSIYSIYGTMGIVTPTTISGNTIQNFNLTNVGSAYIYNIYVTAGVLNITNNLIGSATVAGSITCAGTGYFYGIYAAASATAASNIQGNTISGISYTNTLHTAYLYFMYATTGRYNIGTTSPNVVGSNTVASSISYAGTGYVYGLYLTSGNPGNAVENNIIGNWIFTGTVGSPYFRGMYIYSANTKKNKIFNIGCLNAGLTPNFYCIYNFGASGVTNEYSNNLISVDGGAATNPTIYGFYDGSYSTSFYNLYYNDFNISGPATGTSSTYAYYRSVSAFYTLNNNIFANTRVAGGTGKHYAVYVSAAGVWSSNYNDLYSVAGPVGYYNAADQLTFDAWKTATGGDANSVNVDPQFVSATDLHTCQPAFNGAGIAVSGITTDYAGVTRGNPPDIGAYEFSIPVPTITGGTSLCTGSTGNVYTTESGMTGYIWTVSAGGTITSGGTSTSNTVTVTWNTAGAQTVSVNYFNANGCTASTPTVKNVTLDPVSVGGSVAGSTNVCTGTNSTLLTLSGYTGSITKWQKSTDNWVTPVDIANTATTYTATNLVATTKYRAVITSGVCSSANSADAAVTVDPTTVGGSLAGGTTVCTGTNSTLLTLSGHTGSVVKWQKSTDNWVTPVDIVNTATTYTATNLTVATKFRAVVQSGSCSSANSSDATISVDPSSIGGSIAGSATVCSGTNSTLLTLSGYTGIITKWQKSTDNWVTPVDIANTTTTYTATNLSTTTKYRAVITSGVCSSANSADATVTVDPVTVGGSIAGGTAVCTGTNSTLLTLSGYTGSIVKWQKSTDNWVTPVDIVNTAATYTATNLIIATKFRAVVQSGTCSAANSSDATITIDPTSVGGSIAGSVTVCAGTNSTLLTLSGYTGSITKWQQSTDNWVTPVDIVNTASTYTATNLMVTTRFRAVIQSGVCSTANSSDATVTVNPQPVPTITGPAAAVSGTSGNIYTTEAGMTGYTWAISAGGTINLGQGTNSISVTWSVGGSQWVSVTYTNSNLCSAATPTVYPVSVTSIPGPAGPITGSASVCQNQNGVAYSVAPIVNATGYVWSLPAGATIATGSNTNSITVNYSTTAVSGIITVYGTNALGTGTISPNYAVTVNIMPTPTITGTSLLCAGTTGVIYTTQAGMSSYTWTISAGGTITAGGTSTSNTATVTWNTAGAQTVSVNYSNLNGCRAASPVAYAVTVNALPVPVITGPASICVTSTGNVYTTQASMTAYVWTVSAGGTITAGAGTSAITVSWNTAGAQTVSVNYTNSNGCTAASATAYPVTVNALPVPTITGPAAACVNSTGNVYTSQAGMTNYVWSVSAGGTITAGGTSTSNTVTVTWATVGACTVSVLYTNANGCTAAAATVYNITVNPLPVPTITGPATLCAGSTGNVYTTQAGMTAYLWTVSAGGTITAGAGTSAVTVTWNTAGAQTVSVNYNNANGCAAASPTSYAVTVNVLPVPVITGPATACASSTGNVYTTQSGMTNYVWTVSAGGTITGGGTATSNTVTVTWNTAGARTVSVNYSNASGCSAASATVYNVTVNSQPAPTITGSTSLCPGYTNYTTETGFGGYAWTVSPGGIVVAGQGTNTAQIYWGTTGAQWVAVNYFNASGCSATTPTQLNVTVNSTPGAAGTISGASTVCAGATGVSYYVAQVPGATAYAWTLPAGATIASGQNTNSITVNFTANASSGPITVEASNSCGIGASSPALNVTVNGLPAAAGSVTGPASVCQGSNGIVYSVPAIANATTYTWTVPAGATIVSGANTNSITVNFSMSATSGNVTVFGTNSCGVGASSSRAVTVNTKPVKPTVTANSNTLTSSAASGNQWYWNGTAVAGATSQVYIVPAANPGYYWTIVTLNGCSSDSSNHVYVAGVGVVENLPLSINVYPVPNNGLFTAEVSSGYDETFRIQIYNTLGAVVYQTAEFRVAGTHKETIDVRNLPAGIYSVVFVSDLRKIVRKVFINK